MDLIRKSGIELPKSHPNFSQIQRDLNRQVTDFVNNTVNLVFFEDQVDRIIIPRFYPLPTDKIHDKTEVGDSIKIESTITPRNERQEKVINYIVNNEKGILKLEPGSGKTVCAISAISKIKKKSIIFVHKDSLRNQWVSEILKFTNIPEEDIALLSTDTYEEDLKKPIIVSTIQGFLALLKKYEDTFKKKILTSKIGVAIFDECHTTVGAEKFSRVSLSLNSKRVYGLSATPTRFDGCEDILNYHMGDVVYYKPEDNELLKPLVYMFYFDFGIYETPNDKKYMNWGGSFSMGRYYQKMYKSTKYMTTVSNIINKLIDQDRNVVIMGMRKNALLTLAETTGLPPDKIGIFIPGTNKDQRSKLSDTTSLEIAFKEKQAVFTTYNACRDGNNRKNLDALVMSCPTGNVEQAAGRILRTLDGKPQPLLIDLIDLQGPPVKCYDDDGTYRKCNYFIRSSRKRKAFYESKGWEIKERLLK